MNTNRLLRIGLILFSCSAALPAAEPALSELLRDALYTEEVARDPEKAARQYESLLARHDAQKTFAATALFRLAEVRRKQDRKDDAIQLYQRLIAEFPDAETETKLARENLAALGGNVPTTATAEPDAEAAELARLRGLADTSPDLLLDPKTVYQAAHQGWASVVEFLLAKGSRAEDALAVAAGKGNLEIVKLLTEAQTEIPDAVAANTIWAAVDSERIKVLEYLLEKGFKPGVVDGEYGRLPTFSQAVLSGRLRGAEVLLKHGEDINVMAEARLGPEFIPSGTALHLAILAGKFDAAKWLLGKGAKPDLPDATYGLSPLHHAVVSVFGGHVEMTEALLLAGADPNRRSKDVSLKDPGLREYWMDITPFEMAVSARHANVELAKLLLKHGANPNLEGSKIGKALAKAMDQDKPHAMGSEDPNAGELVQLLGEAGFRMTDPKLMEKAVSIKKPKLIELLLKYGADPNTKDGDGNTFLAAACLAGDADRGRLLLKNGADPKQPGLLGQLIRRGPEAIPMIRILLEAGADPNAVDNSKRPPVVELFDWDFENKNSGNVYLHSDKRSDQAKLLGLLLKHGLDPNTTHSVFVRSATTSNSPSRSGGNPGSPFLEDTTETKTYPKSLLMMVVEMEKRRKVKNVDMIGMLLDAGAKPADEFPEVFDFVATGDDSLPIAKALLPFRPPTLKLDRTGYFMNWNPQVMRLFLDEILNPAIREKGGIHLVFVERGGIRTIIEPNQAVPPTAELLLAELGSVAGSYTTYTGKREDPVITRVRRDAGGQWSRETIDWQGDAALPDLTPGDIIELEVGKLVSTAEDHGHTLESLLAWHLRKRVSFPVTVEIGGKSREIKLRGDLLSYDPTKNEAPLLSAGHLAMLFLPASADVGESSLKPDSILTVRRQGGGEVRMDLAALGAQEFKLRSGDHLVLPDPESVIKETGALFRPVKLVVPDFHFTRTYHPIGGLSIAGRPSLPMPTLIQVLADTYSQRTSGLPTGGGEPLETRFPELADRVQAGKVPVILPHPDFSRIRIKRIGDDGKQSIREVDLDEAIRRCGDNTPNEEARTADVDLLPGDVVELPLKTVQPDKAWNGFTSEEERFFRKALGGTVMVRKQDGIINPVWISYHQADWKSTPHGLVPLLPNQGVVSPRLFALTGMSTSSVLKRDGVELLFNSVDPLLRDGDEVAFAVSPRPGGLLSPNVQPQPRPRVVQPPRPSSN